jgi:glycosyltransferase involved in cell wall biosynthesis
VPVKWDFSDLATTCAQYLSDEAAMNRITKRAYEVLAEYYDRHKIVDCFQRLLKRVDIKT